jgi:hypothetical protein
MWAAAAALASIATWDGIYVCTTAHRITVATVWVACAYLLCPTDSLMRRMRTQNPTDLTCNATIWTS